MNRVERSATTEVRLGAVGSQLHQLVLLILFEESCETERSNKRTHDNSCSEGVELILGKAVDPLGCAVIANSRRRTETRLIDVTFFFGENRSTSSFIY